MRWPFAPLGAFDPIDFTHDERSDDDDDEAFNQGSLARVDRIESRWLPRVSEWPDSPADVFPDDYGARVTERHWSQLATASRSEILDDPTTDLLGSES